MTQSDSLRHKCGAPHSSTLAWKIPWMEESMGLLESDTTEWLHFHFSLSCTGKGKGNPLQCSCLENPRDGGAWWAAVCGVAQSRIRLKRLSSSSQCSCLESPRDRGAWWAAIYGVAQSRTQLKRLSSSIPSFTENTLPPFLKQTRTDLYITSLLVNINTSDNF